MIVPPIAEKKAPEILQQQWSLARRLLSECDKLVVFGFAFNDYDEAIRSFFKKNTPTTTKVILVDVVDHRSRLKSIFATQHVEFLDARKNSLIKSLNDSLA